MLITSCPIIVYSQISNGRLHLVFVINKTAEEAPIFPIEQATEATFKGMELVRIVRIVVFIQGYLAFGKSTNQKREIKIFSFIYKTLNYPGSRFHTILGKF